MAFAALLLPATPAIAAEPLEAPLTEAATAVTSSAATLQGKMNPAIAATDHYYFEYNTDGKCTEGARSEEGEVTEAEGTGVPVSAPVTGLEPNRTYTVCLVATRTEPEDTTEVKAGNEVSFPTEATPPVVESESANVLSPFEARLESTVNPNNETVTCTFDYGITTAYGKETGCEPAPAGFGSQAIRGTITGLDSDTTYQYRVLLENASHVKTEGTGEFTTLTAEAPLIEGELFKDLAANAVTLEAQINPNFQATTYAFEYGTDESLASATTVPGKEPLSATFGNQPVSTELTGLTPRTQYFYRVSATNPTGTVHGPTEPTETFTTFGEPIVTTGGAEATTRTTAAVSGSVNPGGVPTTYHFAFVEASAYQGGTANPYSSGRTTTPASVALTPGSATVATDYTAHASGALLAELKPATTYDYAIVASNAEGTVIGPNQSFTTSAATPPAATNGGASAVTANSATIAGTVDTGGLPSTIQFEFGTTPGAGFVVPATIVGSPSGTSIGVDASFLGVLQPSTTYYYRVLVSNPDGSAAGAIQSFTTSAVPGPPAIVPVALIGWPSYVAAELAAAEHAATPVSTGGGSRPLTNKQKLTKALKTCKKDRKKSKRKVCEKQAKKRYGQRKKG